MLSIKDFASDLVKSVTLIDSIETVKWINSDEREPGFLNFTLAEIIGGA